MARGEWMDGQSAAARPAHLVVTGGELRITGDNGELYASWPLKDVHVDALHEGGVVHIECRTCPLAHVCTQDETILSAVRGGGASATSLPKGRRLGALAVSSALSVTLLLGGIYWCGPRLARTLAHAIPLEMERRFAPEVGGLLAKQTCDSEAAREAIRQMLARIDPDHLVDADVRLVNLSTANAFALPGGVVVLTRGLVEEAGTSDEVVGVLAHELAHVKHRHVLAHIIRNAFLGTVWALTLGDYSGLLVVDPTTAYNLATLRHSRSDEAEADATAARMLADHEISIQGLVDFFERNRAKGIDEMSWLSTHPSMAERVTFLAAAARTASTHPVLDPDQFQRFRNACNATKPVGSVRELFF
jgi:beta-barrel assembly-enhancing protease